MGRTASCSYYHVLLDGMTMSGIYGKEKATVSLSDERMAKLLGLILGRSTFEAGSSIDSNDDTLGNSDISFGANRGGWRRQPERRQRRCGRRRMEAATRTEVATRMEARTATEAATRMEARTEEATATEVET
jgi:hypothetical protein